MRWDGKVRLCLLLMVGLLSSCSLGPTTERSAYRVEIPLLHVSPTSHLCDLTNKQDGTTVEMPCVTILEQDYRAIVRELKAACLALGGTAEQCQTTIPVRDPPP